MVPTIRQSFFSKYFPTNALPTLMFLLLAAWQIGANTPFSDPDTGWHIKAGQWIAQNGKLPVSDIWSYTAGDTTWFNLSWLFDISIAALHNLGGLPLLYILTIIAYAVLGALLVRTSVNRGAGFIAIITVFGFAIAPIIVQGALCRPNIISGFLLLASIAILMRDRAQASWKNLALLPLIMAIWVNVHGSFLILPVLFACHVVEACIQRDKERVLRLLSIGVVTAFAILLNPYGYHILEGTLRTLHSVMLDYIVEWRPVNFSKDLHYLFFLLLLLIGFRPLDRTIPLGDKLFALILLVMTLISFRHGLMLAIASGPLLALSLTRTLQESSWGDFFSQKDQNYAMDMLRPATNKIMILLCFVLVLVFTFPTTRHFIAPKAGELSSVGATPQRMLHYIEENYVGYNWLNDYGLGGHLIFYGAPEFKVFIDGRERTAYPSELLKDYIMFMEGYGNGRKANDIIKKYKIDGLIFPNKSKIVKYLNRNLRWQRVYRDKSYTVFVRRLKAD